MCVHYTAFKKYKIEMYVVSGFERTNSLPENQSVCLSLWVSISPFAYW